MNKRLSIGYFADGPWSHEAFKLLISDQSINIKFICVRFDTTDDTLKEYGEKYNIDYLKHKNINEDNFIKKLKEYKCDLFVSMSFNQIFKNKIMNVPKLGIINCHAGKLPFYRGRNVLNWALINDEKEFGITVHFVDEGIDTGDIIIQRVFPISDQDNYNSLLNIAYIECAKILYDGIKLVKSGNYECIKQDDIHPVGLYCGMRGIGDEIIEWNQDSREIFNFIRAICEPGPKARSFIDGNEIQINKSKLVPNAPKYKGIPGQILGIKDNGFIIKTKDSILEILEYEYEKEIKIGDRLK